MANVGKFNYHANIMLDLECTSVGVHNPALIELAAVYFDLDTGAELRSLKTPISLQSCLDRGLVSDDNTTAWLERTIPETLATSKSCSITLENALFKLSNFVRNCVIHMKKTLREANRDPEMCQPMIWGNGAVADNIWIRSAYLACDIERPWKFYNDMCVRTFVKQVALITGHDCAREVVRKGQHHDALDDCRHQVEYLVLARKALIPKGSQSKMGVDIGRERITTSSVGRTALSGPQTPQSQPWSAGERRNLFGTKPPENEVIGKDIPANDPVSDGSTPAANTPQMPTVRPTLSTPDTSFSEADGVQKEALQNEQFIGTGSKRRRFPSNTATVQRPGMLPTPDTSFSSVDGDIEDTPARASKRPAEKIENLSTAVAVNMKGRGLLSPETSFCIPNEDDEALDPPCPTPAARRIANEVTVLD